MTKYSSIYFSTLTRGFIWFTPKWTVQGQLLRHFPLWELEKVIFDRSNSVVRISSVADDSKFGNPESVRSPWAILNLKGSSGPHLNDLELAILSQQSVMIYWKVTIIVFANIGIKTSRLLHCKLCWIPNCSIFTFLLTLNSCRRPCNMTLSVMTLVDDLVWFKTEKQP